MSAVTTSVPVCRIATNGGARRARKHTKASLARLPTRTQRTLTIAILVSESDHPSCVGVRSYCISALRCHWRKA